MKAIGYARKSIHGSMGMSANDAVKYQEETIKEYCKQKDIDIVAIYSDIGYSGVLLDRPELLRMKEHLEEEDVDVLVFYSQDRLARDLSTSITLFFEVLQKMKTVHFIVENLTNDAANFSVQFLRNAANAAKDRRILKRRLREGREIKVRVMNKYISTYKPLGMICKENQLVLATRNRTRNVDEYQGFLTVQFIFLAYKRRLSDEQLLKLAVHFNLDIVECQKLKERTPIIPQGKKTTTINNCVQFPIQNRRIYARIPTEEMKSKYQNIMK